MTTAFAPTETSVQTWQVDAAHTNVEFAAKHLMISTVKGRFADVSGQLMGDLTVPNSFELEVIVDTASIDTRPAQRDVQLRSSDFFDVAQWPSIRLVGRRIAGDVADEFA